MKGFGKVFKERIIDALKERELTTSDVARLLGIKYNSALYYLKELEKEGKIRKKIMGQFFWSLKKRRR
jgi:predicted transcriptional regulator